MRMEGADQSVCFVLLVGLLSFQLVSTQSYEVPPALVEPVKPQGLRVSIPDSPGVTLFAFHGNVNEDFENGKEAGQMAVDVLRKKNGRWTYVNKNIRLKNGDVIFYWLYVIKDGLGYERLFQKHTVTEFFGEGPSSPTVPSSGGDTIPSPPVSTPDKDCLKSNTKVNTREVCTQQLIFESKFNSPDIQNWTRTVYFSEIESEFVVFDNDPQNSYVRNGKIVFKPTRTNDKYGANFVNKGSLDLSSRCTTRVERDCNRTGFAQDIIPPVISAQITTRETFSFRYGIVEIKAKLPEGDWVVPELWLLPKKAKFGIYNSEAIKIATVFGNPDLRNDRNEDIGNKLLTSSISLGEKYVKSKILRKGAPWTDDFHIFKLVWDEDQIICYVDNEKLEIWNLRRDGPIRLRDQDPNIKPFDEEFYVVLGLHVGGADFPDKIKNRGAPKPWSNRSNIRAVNFYMNTDQWYSTWDYSSKTLMEVEYVRIWSL